MNHSSDTKLIVRIIIILLLAGFCTYFISELTKTVAYGNSHAVNLKNSKDSSFVVQILCPSASKRDSVICKITELDNAIRYAHSKEFMDSMYAVQNTGLAYLELSLHYDTLDNRYYTLVSAANLIKIAADHGIIINSKEHISNEFLEMLQDSVISQLQRHVKNHQ